VPDPIAPTYVADDLIANGTHFVSTPDLDARLGVHADQLWGSLQRSIEAHRIVSVTKGGWVPVPPEYRKSGAPPPLHFIDPMMKFLGHDYYVGFLSAAEMHGASHQAPMVFQVATPALLRNRRIGQSRLQFARRSATASRSTERRIVPTGRVNVSTPEVTVLDLVEAPRLGAGLSNVATIIGDLISDDLLDIEKLASDAQGYPTSVVQRAGYLIDFMASELDLTTDTRALHDHVTGSELTTVALRPGQPSGKIRNDRWRVEVNTDVEHDL
jgi:predicted transcriptional regulator of viral defense system